MVKKIIIPRYMVDGPHMIHVGGGLVQPGVENDYTISHSDDKNSFFYWHNAEVPISSDVVLSLTRLDTGERWAWTEDTGVFVDTRK